LPKDCFYFRDTFHIHFEVKHYQNISQSKERPIEKYIQDVDLDSFDKKSIPLIRIGFPRPRSILNTTYITLLALNC
jgi:hypothetical protein